MREPVSREPARRDTRRGAWLGIYDAPLLRDWLFYWTLFWAAFIGYAIATTSGDPDRQSSLPIWLDVLFAASLGALVFGIFPAYLRRVLRTLIRHITKTRAPRFSDHRIPGPEKEPARKSDGGSTEDHQEEEKSLRQPAKTLRAIREDSILPAQRSHVVQRFPRVDDDAVGDRVRSHHPYPVARAARAIQVTAEPRERYEAVLKAAEVTCVTLGSTAAAWACKEGFVHDAVAQLQKVLLTRGASQGHWLEVAEAIERPMAQSSTAIPGMADYLRKRKGGAGVTANLKKLISERNRWTHGAGPCTSEEYIERLGDLSPLIEEVLQRLTFFGSSPWVYIKDSRLRRREKDFSIDAYRAMGDHPDFDLTTFYANEPLADNNFYIMTPQGPIDLAPLIVMRPCPTCHQLGRTQTGTTQPRVSCSRLSTEATCSTTNYWFRK